MNILSDMTSDLQRKSILNSKSIFIGPPGVGKSIIRQIYIDDFRRFTEQSGEFTLQPGSELETLEKVADLAPTLEKIIFVVSKEYSYDIISNYLNLLLSCLAPFNERLNYLVLINKIDLMSELEAEQLKLKILIDFVNRCNIDVQFRSFK